MKRLAAGLLAALIAGSPALADEPSKCAAAPPVLWGDGAHDDTAALNAWFRGETVLWAQTHETVGSEIADRNFLLSSTVYIHGGTGRKMERFQMVWPHRNEVVTGGTIAAGNDPDGRTGRRWHHQGQQPIPTKASPMTAPSSSPPSTASPGTA